jgi:hypothetical protein
VKGRGVPLIEKKRKKTKERGETGGLFMKDGKRDSLSKDKIEV